MIRMIDRTTRTDDTTYLSFSSTYAFSAVDFFFRFPLIILPFESFVFCWAFFSNCMVFLVIIVNAYLYFFFSKVSK